MNKAAKHRSFSLWNDGRGLWWWFSITHHALGQCPPPISTGCFTLNILSNLDHAGSIPCYTHKHTHSSTIRIILCLLEESFVMTFSLWSFNLVLLLPPHTSLSVSLAFSICVTLSDPAQIQIAFRLLWLNTKTTCKSINSDLPSKATHVSKWK